MKIGVGYFVPFKQNNNYNNNSVLTNGNDEIRNNDNISLVSYPSNYYLRIAFGKKLKNSELTDKIGRENFPSPKIAEMFESQPKKSLYEVHKEYYAPLLDCKTLDEAKELYPEFEDVIDAKDININKFRKDNTFNKIKNGEIRGISLNDLSLELLKKQYGEVKSTKHEDCYFGINNTTMDKMFKELNIKKLNRTYYYVLAGSNPDFKELIGNISKEQWAQDNGTRRQETSERAKTIFYTPEARANFLDAVHSDDFRETQRQLTTEKWANDDGTLLAKVTHTASTVLQTPEVRGKVRQIHQTEEYRNLMRLIMLDHWANDDGTMRENSIRVASTVLQSEESRQKQKETMQTDEYREKQRTNMLNLWANDDGTMRENSRRIASTVLQSEESRNNNRISHQTEESRNKKREITTERWAQDDGTMRKNSRRIASTVLQTQEVRDKIRETLQSEEYREARILAYARHPEITEKMKEIAEEFPMLREIIQKEADGSVTEAEKKLHQLYWKRCAEAMPGYSKIIGNEYHNILVDWGIIDK